MAKDKNTPISDYTLAGKAIQFVEGCMGLKIQ